MNKRTLLDVAKYLLAVGLLVWVVKSNWAPPPTKTAGQDAGASAAEGQSHGLGYVWNRHVVEGQPVRAGYLLGGFAIYCVAVAITLVRWYLLVRALDLPITLRAAFRYGLIGIFFNTFLPGAVGGDIIKAAALARGQSRRTAAVATVIMDRLLALWGLVWFVAILGSIFWLAGLLEGPSAAVATRIVTGALVVVAVSLTAWLAMGLLPDHRAERFAGRLKKLPLVGGTASEFWRAAWMYRSRQGSVAVVLVLTWIGQVGFVSAFYCCVNALWDPRMGDVPSFTQHFLLVPLGLVMQALVPTPGGAGGGEWGFGALFVLFGSTEPIGVLGSLVQRVFSWVLGVAGYVTYLWMKAPAPVIQESPAESPPVPPAQAALAAQAG